MCGIWFYLSKKGVKNTLFHSKHHDIIYESFDRVRARGPERSTFIRLSDYGVYIGFHRLSIMDPSTSGDQPFIIEDDEHVIYTICNGEIYYHKKLIEKYGLETKSGSDCEVIIHLYKKIGIDALVKELVAEFAFVICDINKKTGKVEVFISRDQCGIRPLYITGNQD